MSLVWGVLPVVRKGKQTTDELLNNAVSTAVNTGLVDNGDLIIITAGVPTGETGTTNLMKIHLVGDDLAKGQGIGHSSAVGKAVVVDKAEDLEGKDLSEAIVITQSSDADMVPYLENAKGLVTEEGGLTSHAAVVGLNLGIATIVGVEDARQKIVDGTLITLDPKQHKIYEGYANVL